MITAADISDNRYFILRSNLDEALHDYSYNIEDGTRQYTPGIYSLNRAIALSEDARYLRKKAAFILSSDVTGYSKCEVLMYDKNDSYIGYIEYNKTVLCELDVKTKYVNINLHNSSSDFNFSDSKIWFYIGYEVNPHYKKLELKREKEGGQMFFRDKLSGKVSLHTIDYEFVLSSSLEQNLIFAIYRKSGQILAKNNFNKTDCKYDYVKQSVELGLSPEDAYTKILSKYENEYDLIKLAPAITKLNLTKRLAYQIYIAGSNSITTVANGAYWEDDVNEVVDSSDELIRHYFFAYLKSRYEINISRFINSLAFLNKAFTVNGSSDTWPAFGDESITITFIKEAEAGYTWEGGDNITAYALNSDTEMIVSEDTGNGYTLLYDLYRIYIKQGHFYLYKSDRLYFKNPDFTITKDGEYPMTAIETSILDGNPATFNLGEDVIEYHIYARLICGDIETVEVGGRTYTLNNLPYDDFAYTRANYKKCIGILGITCYQAPALSSSPTKYGVDDYGNYFTSNFLGTAQLVMYGRPIPVCRSTWANTSIWVTFGENWNSFEQKFRTSLILKDAFSIADVISAMLKELDPNLKHEATSEYSQFLYSGTSPLQFDFARDGYGIYISPKSNILKGNYDQAAQKAELSFEQLMNMLRDCYQCYWYIEDGKFKVEHISFFLNGMSYSAPNVQIDLTEKRDKFNKKEVSSLQQEIEYDKSELSSRYEFGWADDCTDLFGNNYIDIKNKYVQENKTDEIVPDLFSADIDLMLYAPDKFNEDGFALIVANNSTKNVPIVNNNIFKDDEFLGILGDGSYSASPQNYLASWLYLMRYYMYNMPGSNISYNGVVTTDYMRVININKCMKHNVEFTLRNTDLNNYELIKTDIGNGYIEEISLDIDTYLYKVELRYNPT